MCYTKCIEISLVRYLCILHVSVYVDIFQINNYLLIITQHITNFHRTANFYMRVKFPVSVWTSCGHAFFLC